MSLQRISNIRASTAFVFTLIVCIVSFYNLACDFGGRGKKAIKIGYLPMVSSLTHFVAEKKGFYAAEGIQVDASSIKTSNLIAQDLATGQIDAGIELSIVPLLKQLEIAPNTIKIFSISSITEENGFDGILVKADSPYSSLKDLAGKRIGVFPGTTAKNSLADIFRNKFPEASLPTFIELDPPLHVQSLQTGDIDAIFTYEPTLTIGMEVNKLKRASTSIYAMQQSPSPIGVAAVNEKWLKENPGSAQSFFKAIDKAVAFIESNPQEARQILAEATNLPTEVADKMNIMPLSRSDKIDISSLEKYLDKLMELGEIKEKPAASQICIAQKP